MADDLKVQKILHKGKHVASIHTFRGRGGNWTSGVHNPDGSYAAKKYGAGILDTKRDLIKKVKAYHKAQTEQVQIDEINVGDFVRPNVQGGEVHRVFDKKGNSLSVGKYHGPDRYGGTKTLHVSKVVKVKKPMKENKIQSFGQFISETDVD